MNNFLYTIHVIANDNKFVIDTEKYVEWKIGNLNKLNENKIMKRSNFRIGNTIWYVKRVYLI
ncbi:hypothetical protein PIROE2DRAFT_12843 [Piromyces sp. E2]|nr:hypothetical protein PIROE2DRAFT_12843 [Piromyces sp. E2]|eukprot:OUM61219.1 hypothetical protein PIROE2DRAFT_12843 [Piromyces sp. E2]